jgi:hypothetical protein
MILEKNVKDVENKRIELVRNWFNQSENDEIIIFIFDYMHEALEDKIKKNITSENKETTKYYICNISKISIDEIKSKKNIILIGDSFILLSAIKNLKRKILFINMPLKNSLLMRQYYSFKNLTATDTKVELSEIDDSLLFIEERNPLDIIEKSNNVITIFLVNPFGSYHTTNIKALSLVNLLKGTNIFINNNNKDSKISNINLRTEYLKRDIAILKEKNILTSRLSIAIYRKSFLDVVASTTKIGRYFSKEFNSKSKGIDLKQLSKDTSVNYDGFSKTKVRAYDLNIKPKSEKEIRFELKEEIKEEIALKLFAFTHINIETAQKVLDLPISKLKKYRKHLRVK